MGQNAQSIESYQQALKVDPGNLKALCSIGAIHLSTSLMLRRPVPLSWRCRYPMELVARSGWSDANLALGNQARADGKLEEASQHYLEILKIVPDEETARLNLVNLTITRVESLLDSGQEDEAAQLLSEILDNHPG